DLSDIPLDMAGVPPFHRRVYEIARAIPPGRVLTYGEVAQRLGEPGAARAVGQALGHNPFAPVIPCHRVLAANRQGGGFSAGGGVSTKLRMLEIERAQFGAAPGLFDDQPT
ncbi:MAG: MGMT family protein, partial [Haliea sp.]